MESLRSWCFAHFEHVLCAILLLTRIGDIGSTWLATPTLRLEANPVVRRLGWKFAVATLLVCLLPYYSTTLAVAALPVFCLVCWSNFSRVWLLRALGEERWDQLVLEAASNSSRLATVAWFALGHLFLALLGVLALGLSSGATDWAFWMGLGLVAASLILFVHHVAFALRAIGRARPRSDPTA